MKRISRMAGFTLPELLATAGLLFGFILVSFVLIHPRDYQIQNRNAARWLGVAELTQGLSRYVAAEGKLPEGLTEKAQDIGNNQGQIDLCPALVPHYLKGIPLDPQRGLQAPPESCLGTKDTPGVYLAGYTIKKDKNGVVTIAAPYAERGAKVSISHNY